jgi:o-succinylbenzoate synthase
MRMALRADFFSRQLKFNFKARTSRGLMSDKTSWFIRVWESSSPDCIGIGEAGPLPGLSVDYSPDFEEHVRTFVEQFNKGNHSYNATADFIPANFPSIRFAFETAILDLRNGGKRLLFDNSFVNGKPILINGLIWMGDMDFMMNQINEKIAVGFNCIKLKVGGLDFDRECDTLSYIRKRYFRNNITIRLDANGAFKLDDVLYKLEELAKYNVHSIEQPLKAGFPEMEQVCRKSPIPIALDEELIGKSTYEEKVALLDELSPQYIILKPTLLGGFEQTREWIALATKRNIGWWMTSALESNIGLNAISQFTAEYNLTIHQGLGTGAIYSNNFSSPLSVSSGELFHGDNSEWNTAEFQ